MELTKFLIKLKNIQLDEINHSNLEELNNLYKEIALSPLFTHKSIPVQGEELLNILRAAIDKKDSLEIRSGDKRQKLLIEINALKEKKSQLEQKYELIKELGRYSTLKDALIYKAYIESTIPTIIMISNQQEQELVQNLLKNLEGDIQRQQSRLGISDMWEKLSTGDTEHHLVEAQAYKPLLDWINEFYSQKINELGLHQQLKENDLLLIELLKKQSISSNEHTNYEVIKQDLKILDIIISQQQACLIEHKEIVTAQIKDICTPLIEALVVILGDN